MSQPSPKLLMYCSVLNKVFLELRDIARKAQTQAYSEGYRFPDLLDHEIRRVETSLDTIAQAIKPGHLAEDPARRDDNPVSPGDQGPAKD